MYQVMDSFCPLLFGLDVLGLYLSSLRVHLGISAQAKIGEVILYVGPVAYWNKAKAEIEAKNLTTGNSGSDSTTYKEKNNIGGRQDGDKPFDFLCVFYTKIHLVQGLLSSL
jgi:hypothetical protein